MMELMKALRTVLNWASKGESWQVPSGRRFDVVPFTFGEVVFPSRGVV